MLLEMRKGLFTIALGLALTGCSLADKWLGEDEDPPLPGARISIHSGDKGLTADSTISDQRILLPKPFENTFWTHNGGNPAHAMFHLSLGEMPREIWSDGIGEENDGDEIILAQPLVVESVLFTMDSRSTVKAYDRNTGKVYWEKDLEPNDEEDGYFGGGIAYADGRIFVSTGFARVFALDVRSGAILWTQDVPAPMRAAPTVNGGRVFIVTLDNQTISLAADDGRRLWSHVGVQAETSLLGGASPAVAGRILIVPYSSGEIVAIDVVEGDLKWGIDLSSVQKTDPLTDLAHIKAMPVIDRDRVIAISHSGRMVAIDIKEGVRLWDTDIGGVQMPWVAGDFIYVLTNDAQVAAVRRDDGRIRWVQPLPRFTDPEDRKGLIVWQGPVLASDRLIVAGSHGEAISLSPYTGEVLGFLDLPDGAAMPPVVAGNSLYFLTAEAEIIAMR
ncbi:PQQ-binding-like beta-propeller repeat protein [Kiloniella laminariae]|uniref:PQQ-binding-like beta-propeller repeat protein n=1 Tax=Kiloniella laminariae TaxID=454162 RepID=A0ABT4LH32_9PROT|nr:PQQ-binding-like beta-propeller repeat protein [Kiloniella laminariae]MCZ4280415.1 PQQ-binding-like beta-propeller repeat protein [Kiloniella laminariae]